MFKYCNFKDIIYGNFLENTWKEWTKSFLELTEDFDLSKIDNIKGILIINIPCYLKEGNA